MIGMVKPKFFIPVHGEQKHLIKHASLAQAMGIPKKNIFIGDIATVLKSQRMYQEA
jgi:ribonuclease J